MANEASIDDLLALFDEVLSPDQVMYAKAMAQVSSEITKERIRLQMNQKDFADYIHASQSLVSRWESGKYNFSLQKIAEIATALDMDLTIRMHKPYHIKISSDENYSFVHSDNKMEFRNLPNFHQTNHFKTIPMTNFYERSNEYVSICK